MRKELVERLPGIRCWMMQWVSEEMRVGAVEQECLKRSQEWGSCSAVPRASAQAPAPMFEREKLAERPHRQAYAEFGCGSGMLRDWFGGAGAKTEYDRSR